jgi:uncharacterized protein (DUF362 family)
VLDVAAISTPVPSGIRMPYHAKMTPGSPFQAKELVMGNRRTPFARTTRFNSSHFSSGSIDRRDVLKGAAAGLMLLPTAGLGSLGASFSDHMGFGSRLPRRTSTVAVIRTRDRADGVARAVALMKPQGIAGKHVNIKPNFNTSDPAPAGTHNDTLTQIVRELQERDARKITLGESSFPPTDEVMAEKGIPDLASDMGFGIVNYDTIADADWVHFKPDGTHWPDGFHLPRHAVEAEYLVSTCCLKTHQYGGVFTMSMKSSVGLTPKPIRRPMHRSEHMRRMIAELNQGYEPDLIIMDGVSTFVDGGPSEGEEKAGNVVIAGTDRVAVDAVGIAVLKDLGANDDIMSRPIFEQEQIVRATEVGLGVKSPDEIELISDNAEGSAYAQTLGGILAAG